MESDKIIIFPLNLDAMLRACVQGGLSCDPQKVCDAIRAWCGTHVHQMTVSSPTPIFHLNWRGGQYEVSGPNLGDTYAYSREQFLQFAADNAIVLAEARTAPNWIDVRVAEELRKRLLPGEKVIWRHAFRWQSDAGPLSNHYEQASVASLAAEFGYTVLVDAGCAAIIRDPKTSTTQHDASKEGQPRLFAKGVEAIRCASHAEQVPAIAGITKDWVAFVSLCVDFRGMMVNGNDLSRMAKKLLDAAASAPKPEDDRPGHREALAIQMLVDGGFVTAEKANEALQIAFGGRTGKLKPAANRSWWKDVKPQTDLAEANDVISCMLEDWQKVGEALGFKDFADPESIIGVCTGLFEGAPMDAAEAIVLLNGVFAKLERDDEYGLEPDLREALRILTSGATHAKAEHNEHHPNQVFIGISGANGSGKTTVLALIKNELEALGFDVECDETTRMAVRGISRGEFMIPGGYRPKVVVSELVGAPQSETETDEFADIREFRRREAEMSRRDAERAAAAHESILRGQFPRESAARDKARAAVAEVVEVPHISGGQNPFLFDGVPRDRSIPVYGGDPEFDALPIGAGSTPEAPVPMAAEPKPQFESTWKRDDEKTMLRILLLSADTTGFHGNDPTVHIARIAKWTDDECRAVDDWCVAMHLHAGDSGVRVPPKPDVLSPASFAEEARPESICGRITKLIAAETRYPEHHFTPVAMSIAQMFTYVDEEALKILDGVLAKFQRDDEFGVAEDLRTLRVRLTKNKRLHA